MAIQNSSSKTKKIALLLSCSIVALAATSVGTFFITKSCTKTPTLTPTFTHYNFPSGFFSTDESASYSYYEYEDFDPDDGQSFVGMYNYTYYATEYGIDYHCEDMFYIMDYWQHGENIANMAYFAHSVYEFNSQVETNNLFYALASYNNTLPTISVSQISFEPFIRVNVSNAIIQVFAGDDGAIKVGEILFENVNLEDPASFGTIKLKIDEGYGLKKDGNEVADNQIVLFLNGYPTTDNQGTYSVVPSGEETEVANFS